MSSKHTELKRKYERYESANNSLREKHRLIQESFLAKRNQAWQELRALDNKIYQEAVKICPEIVCPDCKGTGHRVESYTDASGNNDRRTVSCPKDVPDPEELEKIIKKLQDES